MYTKVLITAIINHHRMIYSEVDVWEHGTEQAYTKCYLSGRVFLFSTYSLTLEGC